MVYVEYHVETDNFKLKTCFNWYNFIVIRLDLSNGKSMIWTFNGCIVVVWLDSLPWLANH